MLAHTRNTFLKSISITSSFFFITLSSVLFYLFSSSNTTGAWAEENKFSCTQEFIYLVHNKSHVALKRPGFPPHCTGIMKNINAKVQAWGSSRLLAHKVTETRTKTGKTVFFPFFLMLPSLTADFFIPSRPAFPPSLGGNEELYVITKICH